MQHGRGLNDMALGVLPAFAHPSPERYPAGFVAIIPEQGPCAGVCEDNDPDRRGVQHPAIDRGREVARDQFIFFSQAKIETEFTKSGPGIGAAGHAEPVKLGECAPEVHPRYVIGQQSRIAVSRQHRDNLVRI